MTPQEVRDGVLAAVGEPDAIFHREEEVIRHIRHGEQLLSMARGLVEKHGEFALTYLKPLYRIHNMFPDFIYPLHVTCMKRQLYPTTLAHITASDPQWVRTCGFPRRYFMVGATHFGVYPLAPSTGLMLRVTYNAVPPIPTDGGHYAVSEQWHEALVHYAAAVLLAKESRFADADKQLDHFKMKAGLKRDPRFGPREIIGPRADEPLHGANDPQT